ncbi:hypothetical protein IFM89_025883 [Coptis chinensis]|uniref:Uncharacterized protein n=1 Tax=Coptis chinensis TaxID=261450 RepID=A0A835LCM7_9MAGN|nr:hypothetical protein IFM89_025883 [Coptis chinensis]
MRRVLWIGNCTPWQSKELLILLNFKTNCFALDPLELQNKTAKQVRNIVVADTATLLIFSLQVRVMSELVLSQTLAQRFSFSLK